MYKTIPLGFTAPERDNDQYEVYIIRSKTGSIFSDAAKHVLQETGAIFDENLDAYLVAGTSMPMSYAAFLPMNGLSVIAGSVPYNPCWFSPPSPAPRFSELLPWEGGAVVSSKGEEFPFVYFMAPEINSYRLILPWWKDGKWNANGRIYGSEILGSWKVLATLQETKEMQESRIDDLYAEFASKARIKEVVDDLEGAAILVALATNRIRQSDH